MAKLNYQNPTTVDAELDSSLAGTDSGVEVRREKIVVTGAPDASTPASPTSASVGTGSGQVLAANSNRNGLVCINLSANTMSFGLGAPAVLNSGITLTPNGVWEMDSFTFTTAAINAIASAGSSTLSVQEF